MKEHFKTPSAVIVMLMRTVNGRKQVLLQRRQNTGFADGKWDFSYAGHVEHGESMKKTAVREAEEELGITIEEDSLGFVALVHKREKDIDLTYVNAYFECNEFEGEPKICEPFKCSEIGWFDIDYLPDDLIDDRKEVVKALKSDCRYIEYGWD